MSYALSKKKALERIFVFQAVEYGYLTQEQLKECIDEHERRDPPVPLLTICKEKKFLKPSQVNYMMSKRLDSHVAKAFVDYTREKSRPVTPAVVIPDAERFPEPPTADIPTRGMIAEEEVKRLLGREQQKRENLQQKLEEIKRRVENFEFEKQELLEQKQQEIATLENELACYKGLSEQMKKDQEEQQAKLEKKEAMMQRERQKSQSLYNLVDQSGKELRDAEELRLKAEGDLQKKYKEIEYIQEKLEKENKEKSRYKREVEELEENSRKLTREMEKLREENEQLEEDIEDLETSLKMLKEEKVLPEPALQAAPAGADEKEFRELTRKLEKKDVSEAQLKEKLRSLEAQRLEMENKQKELAEKFEQLKRDKEEIRQEKEKQAEKLRIEKKQALEEYEKEKSEKEEELHKLRITLEGEVDAYKGKSEQLETQLEQYKESLKGWDELEKNKKEMEGQLDKEQKAKKKAEREQFKLQQHVEKLQKEMESLRQMTYNGELETGTVLLGSGGERYSIQKLLGRGGMGITYSAERYSDESIVVVKTLLPEAMNDLKVLMRFVQEARTILGFDHENLVKGYDVYQGQNFSYFVMEYLPGESVEDILEEQVFMDPLQATEIVLGISRALAYLEKNSLVHRDVKPANIIVHTDGIAKLVDFGIVKMTDRTCSLTTEGIILGTPYYLSPEQTYETNVDIRSDIYSLGATYYHLVVGDVPFTGDNPIDVIQKRLVKSPKPGKAKPDLPKEICNIIEKMMSRNIKKRHESAQELVADMERVYKKIKRK